MGPGGDFPSLARGLADWQSVASNLERQSRDLRMMVGTRPAGTKLRWTEPAPDGVSERDWSCGLDALHQAFTETAAALETVSEIAPDFDRLLERVALVDSRVTGFMQPCDAGSVRWLDVGTQLRLVESPLDIAAAVQGKMLNTAEDREEGAAAKSWIFTSATLGNDAKLTWFTEPCGLGDAEILRVDSPFDYPAQAAVYVPPDLPKPGEPAHSAAVAEFVAAASTVIGGRTLMLTTTLRALRTISDALRSHFGDAGQLEILVQGQRPKRELLERFRAGGQASVPGQPGCILVASASFWEGVDIPGDALQLVVIDKLPFPPPNDPLVEARSSRLEQKGRSPFKDYFLPEAAVALKQGAGRLIRRESDRGILVVCDTRLTTMGYGRRLMGALPPMRRITTNGDFLESLAQLTRLSTTDPFSP